MITLVLTGRNDDYGRDFRERLFRATGHNSRLLAAAGISFEFLLVEWNPLPDAPLLAEEFVRRCPNARAIVVPGDAHCAYTLNPRMAFHEMPAKNAGIRRATGEFVAAVNADILLGENLVERIRSGTLREDRLYRAQRIDVKMGLSWEQMKDPAHHLVSGEGRIAPCFYLGAAGDFCLASRRLWFDLKGYNERIRFATRAKDWQFFLSAAARGVEAEFIGEVYHQEHGEGFTNTREELRETDEAHFGGPWDIEFGLPYENPDDWGFGALPAEPRSRDSRIRVLNAAGYRIPPERVAVEIRAGEWLAGAPGVPPGAALLFHAILAAHRSGRRLFCRIRNPRLLAAFTGMLEAASGFPVRAFCNWDWPPMPGWTLPRFAPEPDRLEAGDWIVEEHESELQIREHGSDRPVDPLPVRIRVMQPFFNPLMMRRLLRAYLKLESDGARRIALYGAGGHTRQVLRWGVPDTIEILCVIVSTDGPESIEGIPVLAMDGIDPTVVDAVLISSVSFETDMIERARRAGFSRIVPLYGAWPAKPSAAGVSSEARRT